jgi:hypothetical protein
MLGKVFIGGRGITTDPRVGRHGILRDSTPESLVHSSSTPRRPVCCFLDQGVVEVTDGMLFTDKVLNIPVPPTPANTVLPPELAQSTGPTVAQSGSVHTSSSRANYRARPLQDNPSTVIPTTTKRKHASKSKSSHTVQFFEDSSSEDKDTGQQSGDGSSSGESLVSNAPASAKRQRTSRVTTRSLAVTPAPNRIAEEASNSAPSLPVPPPTVVTAAVITTHTTPPASPSADLTTAAVPADIQFASTTPNATDGESSPADGPHIGDTLRTEFEAATITGTEAPIIDTEDTTAETTVAITGTNAVTIIDESRVPAFLLHHGKGTRAVDIFAYLNKIQDPHFRQLLFHYIQFEANDKSGMSGVLPTKKRPVEIGQWTSRARPAIIPEFHRGKRTFRMFVDSVFGWWGSIQSAWRTFERDRVSREVGGDWDVLHSPNINGLLNVVVLAYWWIRILDKRGPEGSVRADYEFFVEDVIWVLSRLYT